MCVCVCVWICSKICRWCVFRVRTADWCFTCFLNSKPRKKTKSHIVCLLYGRQTVPKLDKSQNYAVGRYEWHRPVFKCLFFFYFILFFLSLNWFSVFVFPGKHYNAKLCGRLFTVVFSARRAVPSEQEPPLLNPHHYSSSEGCYLCFRSLCCYLMPPRQWIIIPLI